MKATVVFLHIATLLGVRCSAQLVFPTNLTLRTGVLLAPPFAVLNDGVYSGFCPDLLDQLVLYASHDNVNLTFDLSQAFETPGQYNEALALIANDCEGDSCNIYDVILGDYYVNAARALLIQFSPAWLTTRISALVNENAIYTSLTALNAANGRACVPAGTTIPNLVEAEYPRLDLAECPLPDDCIAMLKSGDCDAYADDELLLRYQTTEDSTLAVIAEGFSTQYISWPMRFGLGMDMYTLMTRWMFQAISDGYLDVLTVKHFGSLRPPSSAVSVSQREVTTSKGTRVAVAGMLLLLSIVAWM